MLINAAGVTKPWCVIDCLFIFEYEPRIPKATDPEANGFYRAGGVTSGLVPELNLPNNPLYLDLIDKVPQSLEMIK